MKDKTFSYKIPSNPIDTFNLTKSKVREDRFDDMIRNIASAINNP
ncbi:hypothetical protein BN131_1704 [Cronobacter malonaticus 681]|nr:hypothetical protein BN131_1704 [Cronobacter malonaticus 681]